MLIFPRTHLFLVEVAFVQSQSVSVDYVFRDEVSRANLWRRGTIRPQAQHRGLPTIGAGLLHVQFVLGSQKAVCPADN